MTRVLTFADFDLNSADPELTLPTTNDLSNVTVRSIIDFDALLAGTNSLYSFSGVSLGAGIILTALHNIFDPNTGQQA